MSLAFSGRGLTIISTDTRWNWYRAGDQNAWHTDDGAKLRRVPGGWACVTGDSHLGALGLRRLEQHGISGAQAAFNEALAETMTHHAMYDRTLELTHFLIGSDTGALEVVSTDPASSCRVDPQPNKLQLRASWAAELTDEQEDAVRNAFAERIVRQTDPGGIVRTVARAFVEARGFDDRSMSSEVEIGMTTLGDGRFGHLRMKAADIVDSADLRRLFGPPPALPPFPELTAERRLFTPHSMQVDL